MTLVIGNMCLANHPLGWPQPHISTAGPGGVACAPLHEWVSDPQPSEWVALFCHEVGVFLFAGFVLVLSLYMFYLGKKTLKEPHRMVLPRKSGMTVNKLKLIFLKIVLNSQTWLLWKQFCMWAARVWLAANSSLFVTGSYLPSYFDFAACDYSPLDFEEGAKLPLAKLCVEF